MAEKLKTNATVFVQCAKCHGLNRLEILVTSETVKHDTALKILTEQHVQNVQNANTSTKKAEPKEEKKEKPAKEVKE